MINRYIRCQNSLTIYITSLIIYLNRVNNFKSCRKISSSIHCVDKNHFRFYFCYAMQVGELAGIAVGATVLLNILISGYELI
jgi:hypothetical protein